jgi:hypothetical protein
MDSTFDRELMSALDARANDVTADAIERVTSFNYHPRRHRRRTVTLWGTGGAATIAALVAAVIGVFGPGVPAAFASWTPHTSVPADGQVSTAEQTCIQAIQTLAQGIASASGTSSPATTWQPVIDDVRGSFTLVAYSTTDGSTGVASCLTGGASWGDGPHVTLSYSGGNGVTMMGSLNGLSYGGTGTHPTVYVVAHGFRELNTPVAIGAVSNPSINWNSVSDDQIALGRVGSGVTAVTLNLSDGTVVQTTVANGMYAAWWPGSTTVATVSYTNSAGTYSQTAPTS